jgi:hypothetical protein
LAATLIAHFERPVVGVKSGQEKEMLSAHPGMRAAAAAIFVLLFSCSTVLPQTPNSVARDSVPIFLLRAAANAVAPNCSNGTTDTSIPPLEAASTTLDAPTPDVPAPCVLPAAVRDEQEINNCQHAVIAAAGCKNYEELLQADLLAMGKNGQKLARAREKVLEILSEPNSCADWYRTKDSNPAETFRTLNFEIDRKSMSYISEVRVNNGSFVLFNPYVARVIQEGGEYQTITLNADGAFFQPQATIIEQPKGGGPTQLRGSHRLGVGPYLGGTPQAQVVTLLHELGHLVGLLSRDEGDVGGKSVQNTEEMLRYCRAEIESPLKKNILSALR